MLTNYLTYLILWHFQIQRNWIVFNDSDSQLTLKKKHATFLKNFKFWSVKRENGKMTIEKYVAININFVKSWVISINSLISLWEVFKQNNFKFIYTRRINQDCLENVFGTIRKTFGRLYKSYSNSVN